jgi:uncharacterized protein (TIGR03086 family)
MSFARATDHKGERSQRTTRIEETLMFSAPDWGNTVGSVAAAFAAIDEDGWHRKSRCTEWTVRQAGNHLAGGLALLTAIAERAEFDPAALNPRWLADAERLGDDPSRTITELATRARDVLSATDVQTATFEHPRPGTPGTMLANLALMELVVHGWDVAAGAGVPYQPDPVAVACVHRFTTLVIDDGQRAAGLFGPALPVPADIEELAQMLAHLGRGQVGE